MECCELILVCLLVSHCVHLALSTNDCSNAEIIMGCEDCFALRSCNTGAVIVCPEGQVCQENNPSASCVDPESVPECSCPEEYPEIIPDNYDDSKYIVCLSDGPHLEICESGVFNPNTSYCEEGSFPGEICDDFGQYTVNCTQFYYCYPGDPPRLIECPGGTVYNENSERCELYQPLNCSRYSEDGLYPDTLNCSVFHFCSDGEDISGPIVCSGGEVYDPETEACTSNSSSVVCPSGCESDEVLDIVCEDGESSFEIDCKWFWISSLQP